MMKKFSKSGLAVSLSRLSVFERPNIKSEQYATNSEIAAQVLWHAYEIGDIKEKMVADLGCGTGILGIGALFLGAKTVHFVDFDPECMLAAKNNIKLAESEGLGSASRAIFHHMDVRCFGEIVDTVVQNPPFGTKVRHQDKTFLAAAFKTGKVVYSFHKTATIKFIQGYGENEGFRLTHRFDIDLPIKQVFGHYKKRVFLAKVSVLRFSKG